MPADPRRISRSAGLVRDFSADYELGRLPAMLEMERIILGCDYGGTSWTTRSEADRIIGLLGLAEGSRLLEVGAGSGWPGLYFARTSGCETMLADLPLVGLRFALERAGADGLSARCRAVAADGAALPFARGAFDILSHSDVLCCMPRKRELLEECRRVARPGARMVFSVILPARGLAADQRRTAVEAGPPHVDVAEEYETLLEQSGWRFRSREDLTPAFLDSLQASLRETQARAEPLGAALGAEDFAARLARRRTTIAAIECGILKRALYVAEALD